MTMRLNGQFLELLNKTGDNIYLPLEAGCAGEAPAVGFNEAPNVALPAKANADTCHYNMGHINSKTLGFLSKTDDSICLPPKAN